MGVAIEGVAVCKMASIRKRDPSHVAKGRISNLVQQDIEEFGKIVRYARQSSNSKDVNNIFAFIAFTQWWLVQILLKAAKRTASQEQSMDDTLAVITTAKMI